MAALKTLAVGTLITIQESKNLRIAQIETEDGIKSYKISKFAKIPEITPRSKVEVKGNNGWVYEINVLGKPKTNDKKGENGNGNSDALRNSMIDKAVALKVAAGLVTKRGKEGLAELKQLSKAIYRYLRSKW